MPDPRSNRVAINDGGGGSTRPSHDGYVYDPVTGQWVPPSVANKEGETTQSTSGTTDSVANSSGGGGTSSSSKTESDKEFIEREFNTLVGDLTLISSEKTIKIKVNDTVKLHGLGKYLSGLYFVHSIRRSITKEDGYSHTVTLLKNGFGDSLKKAQPVQEDPPRKPEVEKKPPELHVGDKVKIVGEDAVYSNADDGVKVPDWVKEETLTIQQISSDKTRVLLKEIFSWTYEKYIQKV